ncbi:MAG: virulence RhuM family protein [Ignavibacteriae bacterium]|nr:virulence RhuM family protein [Ignavibacteriota bacterium]MCB9216242.1 virulence RhuM family protein [Ignavibacteria bacterium]
MTEQSDRDRGEVVFYTGKDGSVQLDVRLESETLWLSQKQMALLFEKDTDTIGLHLRNIFQEGELEEQATTEEYSVVQREGKRDVRRTIRFYNLDAIISVGYRVNSKRGTQFRIWATEVLRDHLLKRYSVNRTCLIFDVVTGKLDVHQAVLGLLEEKYFEVEPSETDKAELNGVADLKDKMELEFSRGGV